MRNVNKDNLSQAFIDYIAPETDERLRFVLSRLVHHIHDFVRETGLNHAEWRKALELLRKAGEITDDERNEFVLFSDVLGLSSMVDMVNSLEQGTPSSVLGPFHILDAPLLPVGGDLSAGNDGKLVVVGGVVKSIDGAPIEGAELEIWQTADNGLYSNQDAAQPEYNLRARMRTGADGRYLFSTVRPAPYTVPVDGPVGELLRATGRHPWRPSHLHFIVTANDFRQLVTEVFPSDDPYLDEDTVFGVREKLIMDYKEGSDPNSLPDDLVIKNQISGDYYVVDFDFTLTTA